MTIQQRSWRANRFSYHIHNPTEDITGYFICHKCDNPLCVRPDHLFKGTARDNVQDMISKNRHRPLRGDKNPQAKLTWDEVCLIRAEYKTGTTSMVKLALKYNVGKTTIEKIVTYRKWKDIK